MTDHPLRAEIFGFDSGWGSRDFGCEDGPGALAPEPILAALKAQGVPAKWRGPMGLKALGDHKKLDSREKTMPVLSESLKRLYSHVHHSIANHLVPVVVGGDHSSAAATWSAAAVTLNACKNFGLIWLDAHMDAHTPETADQGKWGGWWHGQPVAALLGQGRHELTAIGAPLPKLVARHLTLIGCHSFEPGEQAFLKKQDVKVFSLDDVKTMGFKAVFEQALARATNGTAGFGLTVDLDAFRAEDAPGVGTAEGDGLAAGEVLPIIQGLARKKGFTALEIAEFNPHNDKEDRTRALIGQLIESVFAK